MAKSQKAPVSVLIPTKNEERNLPDCLASVGWADDIIVFDSHSSDATARIAEESGARVVAREFDNFAAHKNWALENLDFRHGWILLLDADERVTPELADEIATVITSNDGPVGYYTARQTMFAGKWLRHGGVWPDYNLRLLKRGHGRFEDRLVHEHMLLDGTAGYLKGHLLHDDDKGIERFFERHNIYTTLEAVEIVRARNLVRNRAGNDDGARLDGKFLKKGPQRRRALKNFGQKYLPFRPLCVFLYMYFLKLGFLDGRAGMLYARLKMAFEYQIVLKVKELDDPASPLHRHWRLYLHGV
jgi:glycosyltransferase involved in cell wall biosynthesis